jgi:hypothetical protein
MFALPWCYAAWFGTYRRFGTTFRSHLQGSCSPTTFFDCLSLEDWTDRLSQNVSKYQSMLHNIPEERMPLTNCVGRHVSNDVMSPSMRSDLTDVSLSRQLASRRAAVAGTQSGVMTRRSSETLKCRKAPYILYGRAVYLTELLVARHVAPDVTVARRLIGDASRCLPGGTEDNHEKSQLAF